MIGPLWEEFTGHKLPLIWDTTAVKFCHCNAVIMKEIGEMEIKLFWYPLTYKYLRIWIKKKTVHADI